MILVPVVKKWKLKKNMESIGCSFTGGIINTRTVNPEACGPLCDRTSRCTHYTYIFGKCNLQNGNVTFFDAIDSNQDSSGFCGFANPKSNK